MTPQSLANLKDVTSYSFFSAPILTIDRIPAPQGGDPVMEEWERSSGPSLARGIALITLSALRSVCGAAALCRGSCRGS